MTLLVNIYAKKRERLRIRADSEFEIRSDNPAVRALCRSLLPPRILELLQLPCRTRITLTPWVSTCVELSANFYYTLAAPGSMLQVLSHCEECIPWSCILRR